MILLMISIVQVSGNHCIGQTLFLHTIYSFFFFSNPPQISAPSLTFFFSLSPPLSFLFCSCFFLCCFWNIYTELAEAHIADLQRTYRRVKCVDIHR